MHSFEASYAHYYDLIYRHKDYAAECDILCALIARFTSGKPKKILDIGCGTGGHALILARRGYEVFGIDASHAMISIAKDKARKNGVRGMFAQASMQDFHLGWNFDVILCMFNAINYLTTQAELITALSNVGRHLNKEGLFLFDFRNGVACLTSYKRRTVRRVTSDGMEFVRISKNSIEPIPQLFHTTYNCSVCFADGRVETFQEHHTLRFLYPQEISHYLEDTGFEVLHMCPFMEIDAPLRPETFNVMVVAKKA